MSKPLSEASRDNIDKKLIVRLRIYSLIFLVMFGIVIYNFTLASDLT